MASSTGLVLTAGAISMTDLVLTDWSVSAGLRITVGTVAAALVSAGLDKVIPGFGTGAAVLLLLAVVYRSVPRLSGTFLLPAAAPEAKARGGTP